MAHANLNQDIIESVPGRYHQAEYEDILSKFDLLVISNLHDEDFVDFGVMDSKKYASKLLRLMEQHGLNQEEFTMCVVLATAVKSRKRILNAMKKFQGLGWYRAVLEFYNRATCQYSFEESEHTISVVHFSSSLPFLAARIWLQITQGPTVEAFLANLWAAQIFLAEDLMREQKAWENGFWTNTVTKGGKAFEGGVGTGKFNQDYWETKAKDYYLLLNADGSCFVRDERTRVYEAPYTRADIEAWIKTRAVPAPKAVRAPRQPPGGGAGGPGGPGGPLPPKPPGQGDDAGLGGQSDLKDPPPQQSDSKVAKHSGSPSSGVSDHGAAGGGAAGAGFLASFTLDQLEKAATDPNMAFLFDATSEEEQQRMAEMTEDELRDRRVAIADTLLKEESLRRVLQGDETFNAKLNLEDDDTEGE